MTNCLNLSNHRNKKATTYRNSILAQIETKKINRVRVEVVQLNKAYKASRAVFSLKINTKKYRHIWNNFINKKIKKYQQHKSMLKSLFKFMRSSQEKMRSIKH